MPCKWLAGALVVETVLTGSQIRTKVILAGQSLLASFLNVF